MSASLTTPTLLLCKALTLNDVTDEALLTAYKVFIDKKNEEVRSIEDDVQDVREIMLSTKT